MDKIYKCITCNYSTKNRSNLYHHNKTKKHLESIKNNNSKNTDIIHTTEFHSNSTVTPHKSNKKVTYLCKYCNSLFSRSDSLTRHKRTCKEKNDEIYDLKCKLDQSEKNTNMQVKETYHYKDELDHYKEEAKYYKNMLMEAGGLVKKSVSALTYSVKNYDNAPHMKAIQMDTIDTFKNPNKQIIDDVISAYKHKTLNKYLGNIILKLYKTDNPKDQSIWNTDDSRLTYIIKELLNNKSSNWIIDKKGIKTVEYLIDPLLEHIKTLVKSYQINYKLPDVIKDNTEIEMILENSTKMAHLINDIDDGILAKDVLKFISSHLRFNEKSIKE